MLVYPESPPMGDWGVIRDMLILIEFPPLGEREHMAHDFYMRKNQVRLDICSSTFGHIALYFSLPVTEETQRSKGGENPALSLKLLLI